MDTVKKSFNWEDIRSLGWTLLVVLFLRAFIVEPFKIPSGSMIPTLLIGDHLFVSKSSYDMGIPFTNIKLVHIADPKRGDVIVFEYPNREHRPEKEGIFYIKRIVGVPGDKIEVKGGVPHLNGKMLEQSVLSDELVSKEMPGFDRRGSHVVLEENLPGLKHTHWVQRYPERMEQIPIAVDQLKQATGQDCIEVGRMIDGDMPVINSLLLNEVCPFVVPEGKYFAMGDNRDDSADSREWGFVNRDLLKGRALFIWYSGAMWNLFGLSGPSSEIDMPIFRWKRFGLEIR